MLFVRESIPFFDVLNFFLRLGLRHIESIETVSVVSVAFVTGKVYNHEAVWHFPAGFTEMSEFFFRHIDTYVIIVYMVDVL